MTTAVPSPLRFFFVTLRPKSELLVAFGALCALAVWLGSNNPADVEQVVAYTLLLQMFAAATGYRDRAVRGHFDAVLTFGWRRSTLAVAHGLMSLVPGLIAWLMITGIVLAVGPQGAPRSARLPGVAAFLYVSAAAWALAIPLTRYASGVIWLFGL